MSTLSIHFIDISGDDIFLQRSYAAKTGRGLNFTPANLTLKVSLSLLRKIGNFYAPDLRVNKNMLRRVTQPVFYIFFFIYTNSISFVVVRTNNNNNNVLLYNYTSRQLI